MFLVYRLNNTMDSMFESNTYVFRDLKKSLREIIAEEKGMVTLDSQFKSIDIRDISDNYRFIGGKEQCAEFIKKSLAFYAAPGTLSIKRYKEHTEGKISRCCVYKVPSGCGILV